MAQRRTCANNRELRWKTTDTADDQSRQCQLPQRLHTPNVPAGQRSQSPASTVAWTRTSRRIPGGLSATRSGLRVSAAHRPATRSSGDRQNNTVSIPHGYMTRASEPRFRSSEALSGTWWQVKDSNLRSFRDGFTVPRLQACDQRRRLALSNFRAYSPQTADVSRTLPGTCPLPQWPR